MAKKLTVMASSVNVRSAPNEKAAFVNNANGIGYRAIKEGAQYPVIGEFYFDSAGRELVATNLPADYWHWAQIRFVDSTSLSNFVCVRSAYPRVPPLCVVQEEVTPPSTTPTMTQLSPEGEKELRGIITLAHQIEALARHILGELDHD